MRYKVKYTNRFIKDLKLLKERKCDLNKIEEVIQCLMDNGYLPIYYKDHLLKGEYIGLHECHIKPDWLLIYLKDENNKCITLVRTGSHSDLF